MDLALILFAPFLPVLIFYLLDKNFELKIKLVKFFKTPERYKTIVFTVSISSYFLFVILLFLNDNGHLINLPMSFIILYYYLIRIPKE